MTAATTNGSPEAPTQQPHELLAEGSSNSTTGSEAHLKLLSLLEQNPAWTQCQQAYALGFSLGKTNYCQRALRDKGLVNWGNFSQNPNKLLYMNLLNPKGIAQKLSLTAYFLQRKQREFENCVARSRACVRNLVKTIPAPLSQHRRRSKSLHITRALQWAKLHE
jgi:EPS-associated MarR family transcriptional regulator